MPKPEQRILTRGGSDSGVEVAVHLGYSGCAVGKGRDEACPAPGMDRKRRCPSFKRTMCSFLITPHHLGFSVSLLLSYSPQGQSLVIPGGCACSGGAHTTHTGLPALCLAQEGGGPPLRWSR